jgi:hypothetical protein
LPGRKWGANARVEIVDFEIQSQMNDRTSLYSRTSAFFFSSAHSPKPELGDFLTAPQGFAMVLFLMLSPAKMPAFVFFAFF